ncbi:MAG: RNA polymerase sigma factor, partial [Gemmatimonadota bacterium]
MDVEAIFRAHGDALYRYLVRQTGDEHLAQDAVQETFLRLQERPPDRLDGVRRWLFRTGMNVIRDTHRVDSNRLRILEAHPHRVPRPTQPPGPEASTERREDLRRLRDALDELREKERTALLLRESGFKHREIAEELGTTTATIGTLIARSLEKL